MKPTSKRGRRSRPSSLALEEQDPTLKRTRSTHSSPAQSNRPVSALSSRRQDPITRPASAPINRTSTNTDSTIYKEPSPILEKPFDEDSDYSMASNSKPTHSTEDDKPGSFPEPPRSATVSATVNSRSAGLSDDGHVSDLSSLSELEELEEDSEAETERLEASPQKRGPNSIFSFPGAGRSTASKISVDPNANNFVTGDSLDDHGSPTSKKRKVENGELASNLRSSGLEVKSPQSPTVAPSRASMPIEKVQKGKTVDVAEKMSNAAAQESNHRRQSSVASKLETRHVSEDKVESGSPKIEKSIAIVEQMSEHELGPSGSNQPEINADEEMMDATEAANHDEEADILQAEKEKMAMDALAQIEQEFTKLREKLYEERIAEIDEEIRMVNDGTHPELLAMMDAVDKRRSERLQQYNTQYKYSLQSAETTMLASRAQLHSQYSQDVRQIREDYLERVSEGLYQIQRERRASDMSVPDYGYRISDNDKVRRQERQSILQEVHILGGISKYIGFPAAPEVKGAAVAEMQSDLEAMGISRPPLRSTTRGYDDYADMHRNYWGSNAFAGSPTPQPAHHHHHHHNHNHLHHHHFGEQSGTRRLGGGSIPNPATHMSPVTPLPLSALLQDSGPIKLEQTGQHTTTSLIPPTTSNQLSRSPLHGYRAIPPPQAHIHQLQQSYGSRAHSLEPGERIVEEKDMGGPIPTLGIVRYAPVGEGYV